MFESEERWQSRAPSNVKSAARNTLLAWIAKQVALLCAAGLVIAVLVGQGGIFSEAAREASPQPGADGSAIAESVDGIHNEIVLRKDPDGHFMVDAFVNSVEVRFLIDTGASDVVLTAEDAARVGVDVEDLDYDLEYQTANGVITAAQVQLRDLRIGQMRADWVTASVTQAPMGISLLGMSFLGELGGYEVEGDRLVLRW